MDVYYIIAAYSLDDYTLTSSEQSVLVALAYSFDYKKRECIPSGGKLEKLTRLGHTAIRDALNGLRDKGLIDWKSGGRKNKRGRYGQMLANAYVLKLPVDKVKAEMEKKRKGRQAGTAIAATRSSPRPLDGHSCSRQTVTAVAAKRSPNININKNNIEREAAIPDGNGLNYEAALKDMGIEKKKVNVHSLQNEPSQKAKMSPVGKALNACGLKSGTDEYKKYYKVFSIEMPCLDESQGNEILQVFESDVQQGKLKDCPSLPQEFLRRVKEKSAEQRP